MKISNKTLAAVAVLAVSSFFAQDAAARLTMTLEFGPKQEVDAPKEYHTHDWVHTNEDEGQIVQNKDEIEAVYEEVSAIKLSREDGKLTQEEVNYYIEKLMRLGCGFISTYRILNAEP